MSWSRGKSLVMTMALSGCLSPSGGTTDSPWPSGPNAVSLLAGEVVIDAPAGYCLDPAATQTDTPAMTVFFAACGPGYPHVAMSAVVAEGKTPGILRPEGVEALSRYFATERGRKTLSRAGKAENVTVLSTEIGEEIVILHLSDTSRTAKVGIAPSYFRAVTELNGHLVTFSVLPFEDLGMPDSTVRDLLDRLVEASRTASVPPEPEATG